jgi:hypothetical protein
METMTKRELPEFQLMRPNAELSGATLGVSEATRELLAST